MKNKFLFGMLIVMLSTFVMFTGCGGDDSPTVQDVNVVNQKIDKATPVASVTAARTTTGEYLIISWKAVANTSYYELWYQQNTKVSLNRIFYDFFVSPQNAWTYSAVNGAATPNTDIDSWSVRIEASEFPVGVAFRFGIITDSIIGGISSSDMVWSSVVTPNPTP